MDSENLLGPRQELDLEQRQKEREREAETGTEFSEPFDVETGTGSELGEEKDAAMEPRIESGKPGLKQELDLYKRKRERKELEREQKLRWRQDTVSPSKLRWKPDMY